MTKTKQPKILISVVICVLVIVGLVYLFASRTTSPQTTGTTRFLVISDGGGSSFTYQLAQTVAQTGSSVDVPTETAALQAEASATQTVTSTSSVPTNTYGMNEYIDPTYDFSFWYPGTLQVTATTTDDSTGFPGGVAVETLQIGSMGGTSVIVVNSPNSTITDEAANHASPIAQTEYFYDSASGKWMIAHPDSLIGEGVAIATTTADVSKTTMSGLIMLPSGRRFDTTIIPLSANE